MLVAIVALVTVTGFPAMGGSEPEAQPLTLYSGRGESLVEPVLEDFQAETGIEVEVRYGGTSELAVLLQEEGSASPADLFWAQDAGALGALANEGRLAELPAELTDPLPEIFHSTTNRRLATSGRARVLAYSPDRVSDDELAESVLDLVEADPYAGRVGWAPTNGSFQAFVTALRTAHGEDVAFEWVSAMQENGAEAYRNNTALVEALGAGEIDFALVNHYYLLRFRDDDPDYPVEQVFFDDGDVGNLVNVAGAGITTHSERREEALEFLRYLLSAEAQTYFTQEVFEYPTVEGIEPHPQLVQLDGLLAASPDLDLDLLEDLDGTLQLLREAGAL